MNGLSSRRDILAAMAALGISATVRADNSGIREALDAAAATEPARGLALLTGVVPHTRADRLDLSAERAGLSIDAELVQHYGFTPRSRATMPGVARLPGGYALLLRRSLGDNVDPDTAERRLRAELARLTRRADRLFRNIGQHRGSVGERYSVLWRDPHFLYADSEEGRDAAVADMNRVLARELTRVGTSFGPVPAWCLDLSARRLSPTEDAAGKSGYREVPAPGRTGGYVVDLRDILRRPSWTLPGVIAHEMLPGHLLQLGLEQLRPPHPLRIDYASAFVEGWAIYAESRVTGDNPRVELGRIHWLLFRVGRALADIGIHLRGWSLEKARAALVEWQGEPAYFAPFDVELARIPREPASRAAEAMAWLAIADRAPAGPRIAFQQALLGDGRARVEDFPAR